ncbi:MAG: bifunctional 3,4-dihydroxy-2-butanone-4-phosphate synthase/GTP cyclohydrolase II [Candidatus Margulisbacteria bacterium]|nr:bifunctional 3,4-dihydroxy-2-butanone-4-phosphate synthase/GTP cyclohydrolase II [Candidatus Margulisiibacteriota bacterium]
MTKDNGFHTIPEAISDIANGRMVIVVDDEDRENEGDLVMAAHFVTPDAINFMIKYGRGLVCVSVTEDIIDQFKIEEMVKRSKDKLKTAFTVSVDAAPSHGVKTGISASDRAKTIQILMDPEATQDDLVTPGHVFPLKARKMGVLRRAGHTEASVDLARLAGLKPGGVICEIIKENGQMARTKDLIVFAKKHDLKMISIKELIKYRIKKERFIERVEKVKLPTKFGQFDLTLYRDIVNDKEHLAITKGNISKEKNVLVRVHSECLTGDVFHSERCDCGEQLEAALKQISDHGTGALLYMRQEGRGIGLVNKIKSYKLQEKGKDTVSANQALGFGADLREYGIGAQILLDLGIKRLDLLTNNPRKVVGLEGYGIKIHCRVPLVIAPNEHNAAYLKTKSKKLGHIL